MLVLELLQYLFDVLSECLCVSFVIPTVDNCPPLKADRLKHRCLDFTIKIVSRAISRELVVFSHLNRSTVYSLALYLDGFMADIDFPFIT